MAGSGGSLSSLVVSRLIPPCPTPLPSTAYHYLYSRYLTHARLHDLNILEVGLGCNMRYGPGASLNLWRALLPCANISFIEYNACVLEWRWLEAVFWPCGGLYDCQGPGWIFTHGHALAVMLAPWSHHPPVDAANVPRSTRHRLRPRVAAGCTSAPRMTQSFSQKLQRMPRLRVWRQLQSDSFSLLLLLLLQLGRRLEPAEGMAAGACLHPSKQLLPLQVRRAPALAACQLSAC